jgi:hypothetical protein
VLSPVVASVAVAVTTTVTPLVGVSVVVSPPSVVLPVAVTPVGAVGPLVVSAVAVPSSPQAASDRPRL